MSSPLHQPQSSHPAAHRTLQGHRHQSHHPPLHPWCNQSLLVAHIKGMTDPGAFCKPPVHHLIAISNNADCASTEEKKTDNAAQLRCAFQTSSCSSNRHQVFRLQRLMPLRSHLLTMQHSSAAQRKATSGHHKHLANTSAQQARCWRENPDADR